MFIKPFCSKWFFSMNAFLCLKLQRLRLNQSHVKCEYLRSLVFLILALCYLSEKLYLTKREGAISSSIWSQWANKSSFRSQLFKAPTAHCLSVLGLLRSGKGGDYKEFQSIRHPLPPTLLNRVRKLAF